MFNEDSIKKLIRDVPDFPSPGILFRDITPVLQDAAALKDATNALAECARAHKPDVIVGIESRGFLFGVPIALELGLGFVLVRKAGKLPAETHRVEYTLEYGSNVMEIHRDAIKPGMRAMIVDDLLATGGTAKAAAKLVEDLGGVTAGFCFMIELEFLKGRDVLQGYNVNALVKY